MKAIAAGGDPSGAARAVLEKHGCLIDIQCRREREELANVRVQRITRWLILTAVAALLAGAAWAMVSASRSDSLVLEPLSVPPALEARGLTGKVLSARLLDKLAELERGSLTTRAPRSFGNNWQDDIKLDLGGSRVSLGDGWATLKRLLGRETRISGEMTLGQNGALTIVTRAGSASGGAHVGREDQLEQLITRAAEGLYRAAQPYRYTVYVGSQGRRPEGLPVLRQLTRDPDPVERKWAYNGLAVTARQYGMTAAAIEHGKAALAIDPDFVNAMNNIATAYENAGQEEAAIAWRRRGFRATKNASPIDYDMKRILSDMAVNRRAVDRRRGDFRSATKTIAMARDVDPAAFDPKSAAASMVALHSGMHEHSRAAAAQRASLGRTSVASGQLLTSAQEDFTISLASLRRAVDLDERAGAAETALRLINAADRIVAEGQARAREFAATRPIFAWPIAATGLAAGGRVAEAEALIARTPTDCYECVRARGLIASYRGNPGKARRWLREAIRQGPSIPMAYLDLARVPGTDPAAALVLIREANRRGPGWADPLKAWGDALRGQRDWRGAAAQYAEAAERAPRWGALNIEWARALWLSGKHDEAREKFAAAAKMDLSATDRARLAHYARAVERPRYARISG